MYKDLRQVKRPSRKKPGMREFFILILCFSYFNRASITNEFMLSQKALSDYYNCSIKTIQRWFQKLRALGYLQYAPREHSGEFYHNSPYKIPKYKKLYCGEEYKYANYYILDQQSLNQYLMDTIGLDVLSNILDYKSEFDQYIKFLDNRTLQIKETEEKEIKKLELSEQQKKKIQRQKKIKRLIRKNKYYLKKKEYLDKHIPEFQCKYLKEGCLRLTHELCNTVNPNHTEKINESNYWRSSRIRYDILEKILHTRDIEEIDINGSIYRLTYNLFHNTPLPDTIDIYDLIWSACGFAKWKNTGYRKQFKKILMPIYMKEKSTQFRICHYQFLDKYKIFQNEEDKEFYELHNTFCQLTNLPIDVFLERVRNALHKVLNVEKFLTSNIFIYESNLHILIRERFYKMGIITANIYDGFYFKKNQVTRELFDTVYEDSLKELKENL